MYGLAFIIGYALLRPGEVRAVLGRARVVDG